MAAAEAFHLAAQLQVAPDLVIVEETEAIDDRDLFPCLLHDVVRVQVQVRLMAHRQDEGVYALKGLGQVFLRPSGLSASSGS